MYSAIAIALYIGTHWSKCVVGVPILFTQSTRKLLYLEWNDCMRGNLFPVMYVVLDKVIGLIVRVILT
jgi:hypothetical protein